MLRGCADMTYMCVFVSWEGKKWGSVPYVQTLWSPSKPHGLGCLLVCFFETGLFWLPRAIYAVSQHLACSKFLPKSKFSSGDIGPCVFSVSSCLCECSQHLEPKAGVPEGCIRCCIQLQMMGGNSNSPLEASLVKNKLCCVPSVPLKNPFHDLVQ